MNSASASTCTVSEMARHGGYFSARLDTLVSDAPAAIDVMAAYSPFIADMFHGGDRVGMGIWGWCWGWGRSSIDVDTNTMDAQNSILVPWPFYRRHKNVNKNRMRRIKKSKHCEMQLFWVDKTTKYDHRLCSLSPPIAIPNIAKTPSPYLSFPWSIAIAITIFFATPPSLSPSHWFCYVQINAVSVLESKVAERDERLDILRKDYCNELKILQNRLEVFYTICAKQHLKNFCFDEDFDDDDENGNDDDDDDDDNEDDDDVDHHPHNPFTKVDHHDNDATDGDANARNPHQDRDKRARKKQNKKKAKRNQNESQRDGDWDGSGSPRRSDVPLLRGDGRVHSHLIHVHRIRDDNDDVAQKKGFCGDGYGDGDGDGAGDGNGGGDGLCCSSCCSSQDSSDDSDSWMAPNDLSRQERIAQYTRSCAIQLRIDVMQFGKDCLQAQLHADDVIVAKNRIIEELEKKVKPSPSPSPTPSLCL